MPAHAADRNLLFGILALQMDFITRDQLVAGMNAWVLEKAKPLGVILKEQGALDSDHHELLTALVQAHLKKHNNDPEQSLAAAPVSSWLKEQIRSLCHPDIEASLAKLDPSATCSFSVGESSSAGQRFRILRPHAEGGLGKVSVARDEELHRDVALKEIKEKHADDPGSRGRFVLEAEITGGLEHPGIVPVYGLGSYADGRPFYAMRFIRGDSLKDALKRFHRDDVAAAASGGVSSRHSSGDAGSVAYDGLEFRKLLGRFVDVCEAIAYAHSRGVLHRDLKPGNIMLGKYGETLVVDWGLAKAKGRAESRERPDDAEPTLRPHSGSGVAETIAGSAIGTPAYMSPEQAAGRVDLLGPASDIYSLGATLFTLLTNRPPVRGDDMGDVLRKVQLGEIEWPSGKGFRSCPAPVVAICKKAMALRADDRYASPLALAEDIEHWLADEPVGAWPEPWTVKGRRLVGRHRVLVASAAAMVLVGLVALGISTVLVGDALHKEQTARKERALTQIKALLEVAPAAVPTILKELEANRDAVLPRLRELHAAENARGRKMRLALALLAVEPDKMRDELADWLLAVRDPAEALVLRDELAPHAPALPKAIHERVLAEVLQDAGSQRFNTFFPLVASAKEQYVVGLVDELAKKPAPPAAAKEIFKKEGAVAADDPMVKASSGETMPAKVFEVALQAGTAYKIGMTSKEVDSFVIVQDSAGKELGSDDDSGGGLDSLLEFTPPLPSSPAAPSSRAAAAVYKIFAGSLRNKDTKSAGAFVLTITETVAASGPLAVNLPSRQANAAVALLRLGEADKVWPLLKHTPDPSVRSYLIHRLGPQGVEGEVLVKRFEEEKDLSIRRALLLSLGATDQPAAPARADAAAADQHAPLLALRADMLPKLLDLYRTDPDAGLHGAAAWLLTQWGQKEKLLAIDRELARGDPHITNQSGGKAPHSKAPTWWINSQGQTMIAIPDPVTFTMGSPATEKERRTDETLHRRTIGRSFAIAAHPVTKRQFLKYKPNFTHGAMRRYPEPDCPIGGVTWFEAAAYCNWLSGQEKIPKEQWCYETALGQVTQLKENYLSLSGYRLPTEPEWEYACRAGSVTSRCYGADDQLLGKYGWYFKNSDERTWPVGSLKPNDLGMFDMHGNVWTWCQERYRNYPMAVPGVVIDDKEDSLSIQQQERRVLRGGGFNDHAPYLRSSLRFVDVPAYRTINFGFRLARTLP